MTAERDTSCAGCPAAELSRRAFLRDMAVSVGAAIAASAVVAPARAFAMAVSEISPLRAAAMEKTYALPKTDGVFVDSANDVILARWEGRAYAFSMRCPHKGARLEWRRAEERVFCPKHKARFAPDGAHVSGRGSRDLDRFALRRSANTVVVDLSRALRSDRDNAAWSAASIVLG